jgi:hypothetical protein
VRVSTRRWRRRLGVACVRAGLSGVLLVAFLGPSAHAAGKVFRPVGSNPHNRGYESLTPGDPNGFTAGMARSSSDPNRVWAVFQGPNENSNDGFLAHIRAERHASGWEFHDPAPSAQTSA